MTRSPTELEDAVRLLQGAFLLDHSVSVAALGSLFRREGDAPVQQLKRAIADAYGVAWSFPSTNGTTPLNVLSLLAVAPPGATVVLNRACHVSIYAALVHGGYRPAYYRPCFDDALALPLGVLAADVERVLDASPDAACVLATYPNYFGVAGQFPGIVEAAHRRGLPLVADAAHGAHLRFCRALPGFPRAAEDEGADVVLQSTHKTMGALSQGSVALFRTDEFLDRFYHAVQDLGFVSTSFSFPILSSIELAIEQHRRSGEADWRRTAEEAERFRAAARRVPGVAAFGDECVGRPGFLALDPTRVTLDVLETGLTGYDFAGRLAEVGIHAEMATSRHVLFLFTPGSRPEDRARLEGEVARVAREGERRQRRRAPLGHLPPPPLPPIVLTPREAYFAPKRVVPAADAVGAVCGETIAPYPPGSAIVAAGEVLTPEAVDYLRFVRAQGATLYGASDPDLATVRVIEPSR